MSDNYYEPCKELDEYEYIEKKFAESKNVEEYFNGILKLAEEGYPLAETKIGYFYYSGFGVEEDFDKAFLWTKKAANDNDRDGQYNLACFYIEGIGTKSDPMKAMYWASEAAKQGHELAIKASESLGVEYSGDTREYVLTVPHQVYLDELDKQVAYIQSVNIEETKLSVLDRISYKSEDTGQRATYIVSNYQYFTTYNDLYNFAKKLNNTFSEEEEELYKDKEPDVNALYIDKVGAVIFELTNINTIPESVLPLYLNYLKIHTTELGNERIIKNTGMNYFELMKVIGASLFNEGSKIYKEGKNYYIISEGLIITINSFNYCIITAHKEK